MNDRTELFEEFKKIESVSPEVMRAWFKLAGFRDDVGFKNNKRTDENFGKYGTHMMCLATLIKGHAPSLADKLDDMVMVLVEYKHGIVDENYIKDYISGMMLMVGYTLVDNQLEALCASKAIEV